MGCVCAISGAAPAAALEACHLYSYASIGQHHDHGGLLLRRDIHRLFDFGQLAINPSTMTIDVSPPLHAYPGYAELAGQPLRVSLTAGHRRWLTEHWRQHRCTKGQAAAP